MTVSRTSRRLVADAMAVMISAPGGGTARLVVAGEPELAERRRDAVTAAMVRVAGETRTPSVWVRLAPGKSRRAATLNLRFGPPSAGSAPDELSRLLDGPEDGEL